MFTTLNQTRAALEIPSEPGTHYDIMVDVPDRPRKGETVTGRGWTPKFGGKGGNQAAAARRQGVPTAMAGAVGSDAFGAALLDGLDRAGVNRAAVAILDGAGSGMSVAISDDGGDYGAVIVSGANLGVTAEQAGDGLLRGGKVLVLQNEIPEAVKEAVARRARRHGITTILNAAPARQFETELPDFVGVLVVNAIEAEMLGGGTVSSLKDAAGAARSLSSRFKTVIVTAGGGRRRALRPLRSAGRAAGHPCGGRGYAWRRRRVRRDVRGPPCLG